MPQPNIPSRSNPPQTSYKYIAAVFIILAFLLVIGVTYLALSKVTIILTATDSKVEHDFNLLISENPASVTETEVVIAGKILSEETAVSQAFLIESDQRIEGVAEGEVILYNDRSASQTLVATTRLLTPDNILFRLKDQVTIPANSSIRARVYADQKGASGNIDPTAFTIPGLSTSVQKLVYAKSDSAMVGGIRQIGVLAAADVEKAALELETKSSGAVVDKLKGSLENNGLALIGTNHTISDLENSEKLDQQVDSFTLSGQMAVWAVFADRDEILEIAKTKLKQSQGSKSDFVNVDPSSLVYELGEVDLDKKEAIVKISISGLITLDPEQNIFDKNLLVGFTEDDLKLYFSQFETIKEIEVKFSPFWVKKVPILRDHIMIKVK